MTLTECSVALVALRRHYVDLPDWVNWIWAALAVATLVGALMGWWRSTRPANHGAAALSRVRKRQRQANRSQGE